MTVVLYDNPVSGNCYKVRLLLSLLGIDFRRVEMSVVDRSGREDVLGGVSPSLNVPAVILEDGRPLGESNAILWHFAEGTDYLPADRYRRSQVLQWMFFEQYKHEPAIAVLRFWLAIAELDKDEREIEERRAAGYAALDAMEQRLSIEPYLVGEELTIADISLFAYTHVAGEAGFELDRYPGIEAWLARVSAIPGFVPISN